MCTYSVNNKERVNTIIILLIISIIITPLFNKVLNSLINFVSKNENINEIIEILNNFGYEISQFSILFIFWILYALFDKVLWNKKIFNLRFSKIPDLSGTWEGQYKSSWKETIGNVNLNIKQTWTKIQIISYNEKSKSYSKVVNLLSDTNKDVQLIFQYENEPDANREKGMKPHKGFSELIYNEKLNRMEGYYTSDQRTRKTYGDIWYKRK